MKERSGFSLLEVILALAITTVTLSAIGTMITGTLERTQEGADLTMAQLLCESISAQIAAGILPADPVLDVPVMQAWAASSADPIATVDQEDDWLYSVQVVPLAADAPVPGTMVALEVSVYQNRPPGDYPVTYRMTRWIRDPGATLPEETTEAAP